jgi:hypothetical protein
MRAAVLIRLATTAGLSVSTLLYAQLPSAPTSTLPSTATTTVPATNVPATPPTPAQSPAKRAQVSWANTELTVSASNSSLNQILRDISRLTGLKITGGVSEERVFGSYGPGPLGEVLHSLLDGTGSNMLFINSTGDSPYELILTTRTGGPTPPNPNAARNQDSEDEDPTPRFPRQPVQTSPSESQSTPAPPNPTAQPITPPDNNTNGADSASPSSGSNQQSPNGTKTPQQIYEELLRLRQQQQSKPQ